MKNLTIAVCFLSACALGATAAGATGVKSDSPTVHSYKGVAYVTGGVSPTEQGAVEAQAAGDNLELHFALGGQDYRGRAQVSVTNISGQAVLEATSMGPLLFTRLAPGNYLVSATADGMKASQVMTVPRDGRVTAYFTWNESVRSGD